MGGAIALRIAEKVRPAGVIAISPAPMQEAHGIAGENLLFHGVPRILPNTLVLSARIEPKGLRASAEDLVKGSTDPTVCYSLVPWTSHVGVLFSPTAASQLQAWAARVLSVRDTGRLPSRADLLGCGLGMVMQVLILAVQNAVEFRHMGVATSGATLFRSIGGSVGVAAFGAVFSHGLHARLEKVLADGVELPQPLTPDVIHHLPPALHAQYLDAFAGALHTVYLVAAVVVVFSFALSLLLRDVPLRKQH